jgi:hypothetical protein
MHTGGPFPEGKSQPGRDTNHSPTSSAEVVNEQELNLLSPKVPPWHVAGLLYAYDRSDDGGAKRGRSVTLATHTNLVLR